MRATKGKTGFSQTLRRSVSYAFRHGSGLLSLSKSMYAKTNFCHELGFGGKSYGWDSCVIVIHEQHITANLRRDRDIKSGVYKTVKVFMGCEYELDSILLLSVGISLLCVVKNRSRRASRGYLSLLRRNEYRGFMAGGETAVCLECGLVGSSWV